MSGWPPHADETGRGELASEDPNAGKATESKPQGKVVRFGDEEIRDLKKLETDGGRLQPLFEGGQDGGELNVATTNDEWGKFPEPLVIDSGASATVLPESWFQNYNLKESA